MESYSLFQLNEYVRRVIALNFREPLWIEAEIAQIKESRGNHYLELVEKEEDGEKIIAQISGAIWYRNFQFIKRKLGDLVYDLLTEGTQVRIKCQVDFHERYGLKLLVQDIDPKFTFGQLEIKRQEILNRLEEEGLMELNKSLLLPDVIQKIAVISSSKAAGYQDFLNQLKHNSYGYTFKVDLFDSAVQGTNVESETTEAINSITSGKQSYDIIAIIRGGGSRLDLAGYDNYEIAKSIALTEIPFIIGIGHDIDSTVVDLVSCLSLKTPTAVADFIIERNMQFEAKVENAMASLHRQAFQLMGRHQMELASLQERMGLMIKHRIEESLQQLKYSEDDLVRGVNYRFEMERNLFEKLQLQLDSKDPELIMQQGYSFVKKGDQFIDSAKALKKDDELSIYFKDGTVDSKVI